MKKGNIYTGYVERIDFPNKGVVSVVSDDAEDNGQKVIVKNSIQGQTIRFMVNKKKHGKCEGRLLEILKKSDIETADTCKYFGICGGCTYNSVTYENQLKIKENQIREILEAAVEGDTHFEGITGSPINEAYRNKMEFSFGDEYKDGPLALGLHKRNSMFDIVNVCGCQIVDEDFSTVLEYVLEYCRERGFSYYHKLKHEGFLRHLLVRKAKKTGEILVDIVTSTENSHDFKEMAEGLSKIEEEGKFSGKLAGVLHTINDSVADAVIDQGTTLLYGRDYIEEELLGLKFKITPFSFFQTNSLGAEVLYSKAREYVLEGMESNDSILFDLYTGTGTIAQMLAPVASKVIGVEIIEEAVEAAKLNAKRNGLDNCEFIAADVLKALDDIEEKPDFIVLDPPRDGINPKALEKIIDYGVERMVYISCKPTSLARDLQMLQERGYKVERSCCVDMFPNTYHVETVCLLSKNP